MEKNTELQKQDSPVKVGKIRKMFGRSSGKKTSPGQHRQKKSAIFGVLFVISIALAYWGFQIRIQHAFSAFTEAKEAASSEVYQQYYQSAYDRAEAKHHVANYATISLGNVKEQIRLEVLKVSDTEFVVENKGDNEQNITSWVEVQGIGVFTVDLQTAEFIIDSRHQHVTVRVWKPEMTNCAIEKIGKQFWKNDWRNDGVKDGVRLSQKQLSEGREMIEDAIRQNRSFYDNACSSAKRMIEALVKSWNPDIPELTVEVELLEIP